MPFRPSTWRGLVVLLSGVWCLWPSVASAQSVFEVAGERALGMAGAFVAVADDATAVAWNPAGLVNSQPAGMTIGWHRFQVGNSDGPPSPGLRRGSTTLTSLGTWPLGVSYGTVNRAVLTTGADGELRAQSLRVGHAGLTVLQSVMEGLVVGSTLRLVRGGFVEGGVGESDAGAALEAAGDLEMDRRTTFDLDVGVMASGPRLRAGLMLKNLRSPSFRAAAGNAVELPRQARIGVAVLPADGVTLAIDLDLNTVDLLGDLRRVLAVGGETALGSRVFVRSGVRWNLTGDRRVVGALGASFSVRRGLWLDGHYALGRHDEAREVGVALRAGF